MAFSRVAIAEGTDVPRAMLYPILAVVVLLLLIGGLPTWPHSGLGLLSGGGPGIVLVIIVILLPTRRRRL